MPDTPPRSPSPASSGASCSPLPRPRRGGKMDGIVKRVAVAVLLLALLGVASCGDDEPESAVEVPAWAKVAPEQIAEAKKYGVPVAFENDIGMRFVLIPAGTFLMGQPDGTPRASRAQPQHEVILTRPLYVQTTELTNEVYRRFRPKHSPEAVRRRGPRTQWGRGTTLRVPKHMTTFGGSGKYGAELDEPGQPVTCVSWHEAMSFAAWLTADEGLRLYRLPTEAEWEYACRAGTTTAYAFGETLTRDQARFGSDRGFEGSAGPRRAIGVGEVGNYPPNAWGLHDMHGNVSEWCADWFGEYVPSPATNPTGPHEGDLRVIRGGCASTLAGHLGSAERWMRPPDYRTGLGHLGFRLVSPLPEPSK